MEGFFIIDSLRGGSEEPELTEPDAWAEIAKQSQKPFPKAEKDDDNTSIAVAIIQFISTYGIQAFDNGNIEWKFFWFLYHRMSQALAFQRVTYTESYLIAGGVLAGSKDSLTLRNTQIQKAFRG